MNRSFQAIKENNPTIIYSLLPQIDSITMHFKSYELDENWTVKSYEHHNGTGISTYFGRYNIEFSKPLKYQEELINQYKKLLQQTGKWLFMYTGIIDFNKRVYIQVVPKLPSDDITYKHTYGHYYIIMMETELTKENIIARLKQHFISQAQSHNGTPVVIKND